MIIQSGKGLAAEIDLLGAQLVRLWDIETGTEYLWTGDSRYWKRHAPILFPFVGRLTEGVYRYGSQTYEMQIHGFLSHCEFECSAMESDSAEFVFSSCGRPDWPFSFRFTADYHLEGRSLGFNMIVENTGVHDMPYGIGWHPGFSVPIEKGLSFSDYSISFPDSESIRRRVLSADCYDLGYSESFDESSLETLEHSLFDNDAIILENTGGKAILSSPKGRHSICIEYPDFRYCSLWHTVGQDAPFVCIEPWASLPAMKNEIIDINAKDDFSVLGPGNKHSYSLRICVS